MEVTSNTQNDVTVVALAGDVDGKTAASTQSQVVALIPSGGKLVLDMSGVPYMSSAGLRMMLLLYRQAQGKGTSVALVGLSDEIRDTMSATGFLDYFKTASSVDEGVAALSS